MFVKLTGNKKTPSAMLRVLMSVVSGFSGPDTDKRSISHLIVSKSSITKTLSTAARCAERFGFNRACPSKKLILRKDIITIWNRFGAYPSDGGTENENRYITGTRGKASASNQEGKGNLIKSILLNNFGELAQIYWESVLLEYSRFVRSQVQILYSPPNKADMEKPVS